MTGAVAVPPSRRRGGLVGPAVATLVALAIMVGLGTWQLQRLAWKQGLLAHIHDRLTAPPVPLPAVVTDPAAWDYRVVAVRGRWRHDHEMLLLARTSEGRAGAHVVTPLQRSDAEGGGTVLVDRGWVPVARQDPASRAEGQVDGEVTVTGIARVPAGQGWLQPDNRPAPGQWYWVDPPAMAAAAGLGPVPSLLVEAGPAANPGGLPLGGQTRLDIPNDHLQYALTWYGLAVTLAGVSGAWWWRRRQDMADRDRADRDRADRHRADGQG